MWGQRYKLSNRQCLWGVFVEQSIFNSNWWGQFNGFPIISKVLSDAGASQEQPASAHLEKRWDRGT